MIKVGETAIMKASNAVDAMNIFRRVNVCFLYQFYVMQWLMYVPNMVSCYTDVSRAQMIKRSFLNCFKDLIHSVSVQTTGQSALG